jgi:hypothetical protein
VNIIGPSSFCEDEFGTAGASLLACHPDGALIPIQAGAFYLPASKQDSGKEQKIASEQEKESPGGELW